jgi:hypothetical protein
MKKYNLKVQIVTWHDFLARVMDISILEKMDETINKNKPINTE